MRTIGKVLVLTMALSGIARLSVAQTAAQKPAFEVASIKQAVFPKSDAYFDGFVSGAGPCGGRIVISGNRVTLSYVSICAVISAAFNLHDYEISMPDWAMKQDRSLYYEIQSTAPEAAVPPTMDVAREMLQSLLAERFQLKYHREMRELPVYALVVGKNGPKLKLTSSGPCATAKTGVLSFAPLIQGVFQTYSCKPESSMAQLAQMLSRRTDRPVVDRTGIEGGQVFELRWAIAPSDAPSLFTAIQEQLGLKLEATKAHVDVLVIDSVQRPTEN
jgi:uncharacterized protein (TIGR03435 family)